MKYLVLAFLVIAVVSATKWHQLENYAFEDYIQEFGKNYKKNSFEYIYRKALFSRKVSEIRAHNSNSKHTFKKGVNQFSDLTKEEFKKNFFGWSKNMYHSYNENRIQLFTEYTPVQKSMPLPPYVDWRERGVITDVKDQGMCGSCWAHAATECVESYAAINTGLLRVLSQQQITSCTQNPNQCGGTGGCNGAICQLAFDYVAQNGLTTEWKAPYQSYFGVTPSCNSVLQTGSNNSVYVQHNDVFVTGYQNIVSNSYEDLMYHIAFVGPIAISVEADVWQDYEEGVFNGCSDWNNVIIDHAVQLVGYGTDPKYGDYYLVRNSWDTTWGEKGYIRIQRESNPRCGVDPQPQQGNGCKNQTQPQKVCGQCGILFDNVYPTGAYIKGINATQVSKQ